jgi:hypothetical protein
VWPATQYFYATFALPLRSPWLAAVLAVGVHRPQAGVPWAIVAYALGRVALRAFGYDRRAALSRRRREQAIEAGPAAIAE